MLIMAAPGYAYQSSLVVCAPGDTCVYYVEQIRPSGMLTLPLLITPNPITILWSTTAQPMANVITDRPIMQSVADSLGVETEVESGQYFTENILCAVVSLLLVDGIETARLTWMNGYQQEVSLSKVRLYAVGRVQ